MKSGSDRRPGSPELPPAVKESYAVAHGEVTAEPSPSPIATYRIQLTPEFGFSALGARAPYLARLGVSHVYLSPCLQAVHGSSHGYDTTDPGSVRADFGGERDRAAAFRICREHGLAVLLDIVPNHMAASPRENPWWRDLLRWGSGSPYADYFDVDWTRHARRILLPILGAGNPRQRSEARLELGATGFELNVCDHALPVAARSLPLVLAALSGLRGSELGTALAELERRCSADATRTELLEAEREIYRGLEQSRWAVALSELLERLNAAPEKLRAILEAQHYRLRHWRAGLDELNYRRFFDISDLAAVRVEEPRVFDAVHALIRRWVSEGEIAGVRVDHPDGLSDPAGYFERLRAQVRPPWVVAEKILAAHERLPSTFQVDGTTGYDFLNVAGRLFVDPSAEHELTQTYCRLAELPSYDVQRAVYAAKGRALRELLGAEVAALTAYALPACEGEGGPSFSAADVQRVLVALITGLPVYRTYLRPGWAASESDLANLEAARRHALNELPELAPLVARLLDLLLGSAHKPRHERLCAAFQQLSGPAMAKGLEDTVLYDDARLLALNEVGGDPGRFGGSLEEFHEHCRHIQAHWPRTLLASSTHDTKRSEDARLRIALLSELPGIWAAQCEAWMQRARSLPGGNQVDPRTLYFLLQTLVGVWPISESRLTAYLLKAVREAKAWTSWLSPDVPREGALAEFVRALYLDEGFGAELVVFVERLWPAFERHSLAFTLLKLSAPGIPDIYQGTELWDFSLADPDNRRPVDFSLRERLLGQCTAATEPPVVRGASAGEAKLWIIQRALWVRRERPECFDERGSYTPLQVEGREGKRVVAFLRGAGVVIVAPRLTHALTDWEDTRVCLPPGSFVNALTGQRVQAGHIGSLLQRFPVALLVRS
ncbi:MAG TPA: malto-oligosyltrehalose synthase [Polyangiaceae bacterium]|nr:malto-oligosyltrehalose synthase [Polyangiaceae bacterium]